MAHLYYLENGRARAEVEEKLALDVDEVDQVFADRTVGPGAAFATATQHRGRLMGIRKTLKN